MEINFLACPNCGSTYFTNIRSGEKIIFRVNALYVPLVMEEETGQGLELVDLAEIRCGACSWGGSFMELVPSRE